jgi:hypothetical protein
MQSGTGSAAGENNPRMETSLAGEAEQEEAGNSLDMLIKKADMR